MSILLTPPYIWPCSVHVKNNQGSLYIKFAISVWTNLIPARHQFSVVAFTSKGPGEAVTLMLSTLPDNSKLKLLLLLCSQSKLIPITTVFLVTNYRKHRKFQGVFNFVVFVDATIPQNLILSQQFTQMAGTRIDYNAECSANSRQSKILP